MGIVLAIAIAMVPIGIGVYETHLVEKVKDLYMRELFL